LEKATPDILLLSVHHLELLKDWKRKDSRLEKAGYSVYLGGDAMIEMISQYGSFQNICTEYFSRLEKAMDAGFQDTCSQIGIAHLNMFRRAPSYDKEIILPFMLEAIDKIAEKGFAMELNFHYFEKHHEPRPPLGVAKKFLENKGKLWFGSDSHSVESLQRSATYHMLYERLIRSQD
jgi:histidinol phosphatase-like PHP family hydrolase